MNGLMTDDQSENTEPKAWEKGGPSPNPGGRPKGSLGLTGALKHALEEGGREAMMRSIRKILSDPNHRHFATIANHVFDRIEGKPTDARDRAMERMLSRIELVHGRPQVPIPGLDMPKDENGPGASVDEPGPPLGGD